MYSLPVPDDQPEIDQPAAPTKWDASQDVLELVDAGVAKGLGSREYLLLLYTSFTKLMANRLLNENKPVDLGFVVLHCSPYRANWKEITRKRNAWYGWAKVGKGFRGNPATNPESPLVGNDSARFRYRLTRLDLLAMHHIGGYVYRRVEVEHTWRWWWMVKKIESSRLLTLGDKKYAQYVIASIVSSIEATVRIYRKWFTAVSRRDWFKFEYDSDGLCRFVPTQSRQSINNSDSFPLLSCGHGDLIQRFGSGEPEDLPVPVEKLQGVSAAGQETADVRDAGVELGNVAQPNIT